MVMTGDTYEKSQRGNQEIIRLMAEQELREKARVILRRLDPERNYDDAVLDADFSDLLALIKDNRDTERQKKLEMLASELGKLDSSACQAKVEAGIKEVVDWVESNSQKAIDMGAMFRSKWQAELKKWGIK